MARPRSALVVLVLSGALAAACQSYSRTIEPPPHAPEAEGGARAGEPTRRAPAEPGPKTVFPGIRVDTARRVVEVDAAVSPLIFEPYEGRFFYLEQFVCERGTKDHESLVVTEALPSQIHAALLLIGLEPGRPVVWTYPEGRAVAHPPEGPRVGVEFVVGGEGPEPRMVAPRDWAVEKEGSRRFPEGTWVFAGSNIAGTAEEPFYEADAAGTIVGLASFGTEVLAWARPISHEEADEQLEWVADLEAMPPAGTPVVVRLRAIER